MDDSPETKKIETPKVLSEEEPSWWDRIKQGQQDLADAERKKRIKQKALRSWGTGPGKYRKD